MHAQGLKLGIYTSAGTKTCEGLPASLDHEMADAKKFAEWGVTTSCTTTANDEKRPDIERYTAMDKALKATGRPIVYSLCNWGPPEAVGMGRSVGGMLWRTTGDISDIVDAMIGILDQQVGSRNIPGRTAGTTPICWKSATGR